MRAPDNHPLARISCTISVTIYGARAPARPIHVRRPHLPFAPSCPPTPRVRPALAPPSAHGFRSVWRTRAREGSERPDGGRSRRLSRGGVGFRTAGEKSVDKCGCRDFGGGCWCGGRRRVGNVSADTPRVVSGTPQLA